MKWIQRRADLSGVNCSQSFLDFDRFGRKCDHLGLDTLSLKKNLASCSILLRLYTPGLTPPGGSAIPKWGPGLTHLLAFHQLWLVGYTHPPKSPMGYASDACTDSWSLSVFCPVLLFTTDGNRSWSQPICALCGCFLMALPPGLTPPGGSAIPLWGPGLTAIELFTKSWGPVASHTVRTYGRPSPESR